MFKGCYETAKSPFVFDVDAQQNDFVIDLGEKVTKKWSAPERKEGSDGAGTSAPLAVTSARQAPESNRSANS